MSMSLPTIMERVLDLIETIHTGVVQQKGKIETLENRLKGLERRVDDMDEYAMEQNERLE